MRPRALVKNQHTRALISRSKNVTQTQQQRPESPTVTRTWHASKYKVRKLHQRDNLWWNLCPSVPCIYSLAR